MYSYFLIVDDIYFKGHLLFDINDPTHTFNVIFINRVKTDSTIYELATIDRSGNITWFGHLFYTNTLLYADGKTYNFIVKGYSACATGYDTLFLVSNIKWLSSNYFVFYIEYKTIVIIIDLRSQCRLKISFNKRPIFGDDDEYIILPYGKIGIIAISTYGLKEVDTTQEVNTTQEIDTTQEYTYTHGEFTSTPPKRYTIIMPKSTGAATKPAIHI